MLARTRRRSAPPHAPWRSDCADGGGSRTCRPWSSPGKTAWTRGWDAGRDI